MLLYEWRRYYDPKLGQFIYKHKGNGLIVDAMNLKTLNEPKKVYSFIEKKLPKIKKVIKDKQIEKSGDLIMKKLVNSKKGAVDKIINQLLN